MHSVKPALYIAPSSHTKQHLLRFHHMYIYIILVELLDCSLKIILGTPNVHGAVKVLTDRGSQPSMSHTLSLSSMSPYPYRPGVDIWPLPLYRHITKTLSQGAFGTRHTSIFSPAASGTHPQQDTLTRGQLRRIHNIPSIEALFLWNRIIQWGSRQCHHARSGNLQNPKRLQ